MEKCVHEQRLVPTPTSIFEKGPLQHRVFVVTDPGQELCRPFGPNESF